MDMDTLQLPNPINSRYPNPSTPQPPNQELISYKDVTAITQNGGQNILTGGINKPVAQLHQPEIVHNGKVIGSMKLWTW